MANDLRALYRRRLHSGRSKAAIIIDYILLRLAMFLVAYIALLFLLKDRSMAAFLALVLVSLFSIAAKVLNDIRLESFVESQRARLIERFTSDMLLFMREEDFMLVCKGAAEKMGLEPECMYGKSILARDNEGNVYIEGWQRHYANEAGPQDLVEFYFRAKKHNCSRGVILSTSGFSDDARLLASRSRPMPMTLKGIDALREALGDALPEPDDDTIEEMLKEELSDSFGRKAKLKDIIFSRDKTRRYAMCGIILAFASFITGYNVYYQIFSGICFVLSGVCAYYSHKK